MKIFRLIKYLYYFLRAKTIILFHYDKRYISGRHFKSSHHSLGAYGWDFVVKDWVGCKKNKVNLKVKFPVTQFSRIVGDYKNIHFHNDDLNIFQNPGLYIQAIGHITIGRGTYIGPNVGLITANHDFNNLDLHSKPKDIIIGERCWIGMNSMILPGVELANHVIVGAGSVVTKSILENDVVVCGNPAKIIKKI